MSKTHEDNLGSELRPTRLAAVAHAARRSYPLTLWLTLAACPGPGQEPAETASEPAPSSTSGTTSTSETATGTTGESTTGEPTTTTTGESTTGGPTETLTRVLYHPYTPDGVPNSASAVRSIDIVDGVPMSPVTVLDPPTPLANAPLFVLEHRWQPYFTGPFDAPRLWLVDTESSTSHEVALPPEVDRVGDTFFSRQDRYLLALTHPPGSYADIYYFCEIGPTGECALQLFDPPLGRNSYPAKIIAMGASGRIWYRTQEKGVDAEDVLQVDLATPDAPVLLHTFTLDANGGSAPSLDEKTMYFGFEDGRLMARDVSIDPPGPLVELIPPVEAKKSLWSDDEKDIVMHVSSGDWGDLFHVSIDGTSAGPMVQLNTGAPSNTFWKHLQWISDKRVLYLTDFGAPGTTRLYMADTKTPDAPPQQVSGSLPLTGSVESAMVLADPTHALYLARQTEDGADDLYRASLDPPGEAHKLNGPLAAGESVPGYLCDATSDGTRVLYGRRTEADGPDRHDVFLVNFDGEVPLPPVNLSSALPDGIDGNNGGRFSADGTLVFFGGASSDGHYGPLYMVKLSPEIGPPVQISDPGEAILSYFVLPAK